MSRSGMISLAVVLLVGLLVWAGLQGIKNVTCDICLTYNGQTECRTGEARTREEAINKARDAICAVLANGRAENIQCGRTEPDSIECR